MKLLLTAAALACALVPLRVAAKQDPIRFEDHELNAKFMWALGSMDREVKAQSMYAQVYFTSEQGKEGIGAEGELSSFGTNRSPFLKGFSVIGSWSSFFGQFVQNASVVWWWADSLPLEPVKLRPLTLHRSDLAEHPDLLRRFRDATINFDLLEIRLDVLKSNQVRDTITLHIPSVHMIIGSEGEVPLMVPGSPQHWRDFLHHKKGKEQTMTDAELKRLWRDLVRVERAEVKVYGLRVPLGELRSIATEVERRKKEKKDLEKKVAALDPSTLDTPSVKPFKGPRELVEPYEEQGAEPFTDSERKRVGLRAKNGRTLFETSRDQMSFIRNLEGSTRYFEASARDGLSIINRRGTPVVVDGHRVFRSVVKEGDGYWLERELSRSSEVGNHCSSRGLGLLDGKLYRTASEPRRRIETEIAAAERRWAERYRGGSKNEVIFCGRTYRFHVAEVARYRVSAAMELQRTERGYQIVDGK